jgi:hypothetical protein
MKPAEDAGCGIATHAQAATKAARNRIRSVIAFSFVTENVSLRLVPTDSAGAFLVGVV